MNLNSRPNPSEMSTTEIEHELRNYEWEYVALADWARSDEQYSAGEVYLNERQTALVRELEIRKASKETDDLFCSEHQRERHLVDYEDGSRYECPECQRERGEELGLR